MLEFRSRCDVVACLTGVQVSFNVGRRWWGVDVSIPRATLTVITGRTVRGSRRCSKCWRDESRYSGAPDHQWKPSLSMPQRAAVPSGLTVSVKDVVSVGAWGRLGLWRRMDAAAREVVARSMERLDISALARHPFALLSGGQQQRTLLAQGLARGADLLLLDEPTTGLDVASALRIPRCVARGGGALGSAVVCVSHDPSVIGDAERRISLQEGRVCSDV